MGERKKSRKIESNAEIDIAKDGKIQNHNRTQSMLNFAFLFGKCVASIAVFIVTALCMIVIIHHMVTGKWETLSDWMIGGVKIVIAYVVGIFSKSGIDNFATKE